MLKRVKKIFRKDGGELSLNIEQDSQFLSAKLQENLALFKGDLEPSTDVVYRSFEIKRENPIRACVIYLDNMVDKKALEEHVLAPLMGESPALEQLGEDLLCEIKEGIIEVSKTSKINDLQTGLVAILSGQGLLLVDGLSYGFVLGIKKMEMRAIEESAAEPVVEGPRDGFIEVLGVNITLLRRRLKTSSLKIEKYQVGSLSKTDVVIVYIDSIVEKGIVEEVKKRLLEIEIDGVLESNYLVEYMEDSPWSPFPQIGSTDRPDAVVAGLLDGQVAVLVDNTPFALLMPVVFTQFLYASEDYYIRYIYASFTRLIRFAAVNIALLLPSFYIAIVTFHQELLPTNLLLSIAAGRERVPFPAFVEAFMMETTFEILREAGVRLPRPVGQATSIVGALVIGNAAVAAGLVSPAMVIVVAVTALASFIIPSPAGSFVIRLLRFPIMFLAAALGLYGVMLSIMAILIHLSSLRSFGVPYLSPLAPLLVEDLNNTFIRVPWWKMINRPHFYKLENRKRQKEGQKPKKPPEKGGVEK